MANLFFGSTANAPEFRSSPLVPSQSATRFAIEVAIMEGGARVGGDLFSLITRKSGTSVANYLESASLDKVGKTRQYIKSGGFDQAIKDFESLVGKSDVKIHPGGLRTSTLQDGTTVSVRPFSTGNKPTVQITPPTGKQIKVRYE